jgi:DNA-binding NarL/FixJ family response regulator
MLASTLDRFDPELVLLDLHLADGASGIDLIPMLRNGDRSIVVLTSATDPTVLAKALEAGADDVFDKTVPFPYLVDEITAVRRGVTPEREARRHAIRSAALAEESRRERVLRPFQRLTRSEQVVLAQLIDGVRAAAIAEGLCVSLTTVRSHIQSILTKLDVGSQLAAVSAAAKAGWAPAEVDS